MVLPTKSVCTKQNLKETKKNFVARNTNHEAGIVRRVDKKGNEPNTKVLGVNLEGVLGSHFYRCFEGLGAVSTRIMVSTLSKKRMMEFNTEKVGNILVAKMLCKAVNKIEQGIRR